MGDNAKIELDPGRFDFCSNDLVMGEEILEYAVAGLGTDLSN